MTPNPEQIDTNTPAQAATQNTPPAPAIPAASSPTATPAPTLQQPPAATGAYAPYNPYAPYAQQNPYGAPTSYAQYPQYPQYQYPQYPGYAQHQYPGYPPYAPPVAATAATAAANGATATASGASGEAAGESAAKSRRPGLYALIFGVTLTVLLIAVIALAAFAPSFRASEASAIPQGWAQVYNSNLTTGDDGRWDETAGCSSQSDGLEAGGPTSDSAGGVCVFKPSAATDLTSAGFLLDVTLAAPNNVPGDQEPTINIGDTTYVVFNQQGTYDVCDTSCDSTTPGSLLATGTTSAWHVDGYVGNTIGVELSADNTTLTVFVNGVAVVSTAVSISTPDQSLIAIGAAQGGQAIFTHATLYTGSANSI